MKMGSFQNVITSQSVVKLVSFSIILALGIYCNWHNWEQVYYTSRFGFLGF